MSESNWVWLQNGNLKQEIESLIVAAQNQSRKRNQLKQRLTKARKTRYADYADESIDHVVIGCSKLAQKEYKRRHNNVDKMVR